MLLNDVTWFNIKKEYVYTLNIDEYYRYLDYLDKLGFDSNLLNAFASVYEEDIDNINPLPYLEGLKKISDECSLTNFYKQRIKKIGKWFPIFYWL